VGDTTARATVLAMHEYDTVVRPRTSLVRSTALSILFSVVPVGVAMTWMSVTPRAWAVLVVVVLVLALAVSTAAVRLRAAFVGVEGGVVTVRGVLSRERSFARAHVAELVVATTHGLSVDRTRRELVALDQGGTPLFRVRGDVWGEDGLDRVVAALELPTSEMTKPMSMREFVRRWPGSRAWYEHPRGWAALAGVAGLVVLGLQLACVTGLLPR
jgi:hypothetical protein